MTQNITDFVRDLFTNDKLLTVEGIYKKVLENKSVFSSFPTDYRHRVRSTLYSLKKNGEIVSVEKGMYQKAQV